MKAIAVVIAASCLTATPSLAATTVSHTHTGDDGLSNKTTEAIVHALETSEFMLVHQEEGDIVLYAPAANVRPIGRDQFLMKFSIALKRSKTKTYRISCSESRLDDCADAVIRQLRKAARSR